MGLAGTVRQIEEWVLPRAQVEAWLETAAPGARLTYAHGRCLIQGDTSLFVRQLALDGIVDPAQPRAADGGFDYTIQKRSSRFEAPRSAAREAADDPALDVILRMFTREANFGERASSNRDLAKAAGLATRDQAAARVRKLIELGRIKTAAMDAGPYAGWRWVTITATGKSTRPPPTIAAARKEARQESPTGGAKGPPDLPGRLMR